jgi:UDP-glucose 4-epimerase
VDKLIEQDHEVYVLDNFSTGCTENINPKVCAVWDMCAEDVTDAGGYHPKYDVIYHMAALARIQPSFVYPTPTSSANVNGTYKMLEFARQSGSKFIYPGSSSFYHDVYANPYTFTKWVGEEYCKLYSHVYGVSTVIARFFNVYGPRQIDDGAYATVIGIFERQKRTGQPLTVTGDGTKRRDFTHVYDIVNGLISLSEKSWKGEIFNFGTGKNYSIKEVADMFEAEITYLPNRPGEAQTTLADISKSREIIGYEPQYDLESYIKSFVRSLDSDTL